MAAPNELTRIKGNIQKMLSQNAPETDIDAYVASEGFSAADLRDPVRFEVKAELNAARKAGAPIKSGGMPRQFLQGGTFGFGDEILAGLTTPLEMIKRKTFSPAEAYKYTKAREDILMDEARQQGGLAGTGMEIAGGLVTGSALARGGLTAMPANPATATTARNIGGMAADGAMFGAVTGAGEANGADRVAGAATGAGLGALAGGAVGAAVPVVSAVGRNALGWASAVRDPAGYAERQLARGIMESGQAPANIAAEVQRGAAAGQPYTIADALGNPGQRLLSAVTRAPGEGRTNAVNFLDARQAGQGRRIAQALADTFDAARTSDEARTALTATRRATGNANYGAARQAAGSVDTSAAITALDDVVSPGVTQMIGPGAAENSVYGALTRMRSMLGNGRSQVRDFDRALLAKQEMDALIEKGGTVAALLRPARNALDDALAAASQPYAAARDAYRQQSRVIEALDTGRTAATRGRTENTTRTFAGLSPEEQGSFRVGYADPLIENVQGAPVGVNKARPFTSDAAQTEIDAFAVPGRAPALRDALTRENRMFETRAMATGGSRTADNLADEAALGVNPEIITNLMSGNLIQAGRNILSRSSGALSGNTSEVRRRLAEILLQGGTPDLQAVLQRAYTSEEARRRAIMQALRGALGGTAAGAGNVQSQRTK